MAESVNIPELMGRLHRLHRQISVLNSRLKQAERKILIQKKKIADAKTHYEEIKGEYTALLLKAKEKEALFAQSEESLARRRTQLNEAKSNKEYQSLKDQIAHDQMINDQRAEEVLEIEEEAKEFLPKVQEAEAAVKETEEGLIEASAELKEVSPVIQEDIQHISEVLAKAETELPRDFRGIYPRLVKSFGGVDALAPIVDHSFCGHCRQQIPLQYIAQVCEGKPFVCLSCGRLIYLPEDFAIK